jgi:acetyl esterase
MPVDPQVRYLLDEMAKVQGPPPESRTLQENRQLVRDLGELGGPAEDVASVLDTLADTVPIRIYTPAGEKPFPVLVYYHGGGWVVGDLDSHDRTCRALANRAGCLVVSVDYRLAPEHPFPAAVDDSYAALGWVAKHICDFGGDSGRLAVGGDSAGGNLGAVVAQLARDRGGPVLAFQLLIYPATDSDDASPSMLENAEGYLLTKPYMDWFKGHYLPNPADGLSPLVSPARTGDLSGLPPALVVTAEFDPLRDQGAAYAQRLADAGVPSEHLNYDGMIHGFFQMTGVLPAARDALAKSAAALRTAFAA